MLDATTLFPMPAQGRPIDTRPMIVDSFAGGGGASTGIEMALGRSPDIAIDHSETALALHAANHPETLHLSENVYRVDPLHHMHGRHIGLMWFSPDCKDFSKAKGGTPVRRNIRDLAWIIPGWIERIQKSRGRVDVVLMENVEEFKGWGPLIQTPKGLFRDPERIGETFTAWCKALRRLGGKIETRELRGCDYGAPTIRKRLFIVVRFDRQRIVWPKPTHGAPDSPEVRSGKLLPWPTAADCIDWSLPCPSIFDTKAQIKAKYGVQAVRPLADNTLARVARGMKRYVLEAERPFVVNTANSKTTGRGPNVWSVDDPLRTITSAPGFSVIAPALATFYGHNDGRGTRSADMQEPLRTVTVENRHAVIAPYLASIAHGDSGGRREYPLTDPLGTITMGGIQHAVIAPHLLSLKGTARRSMPADTPHPTVLAGGGHSSIIAPVLTYAQQGGGNRSVADPHHTICASRKDQNAVIIPTLIQTGYGERKGQAPRSLDLHQPIGTVVAGAVKHATVVAFIAQHHGGPRMGGNAGHDAREPISTIAGTGSHQMPVTAFMARHFGHSVGHGIDEPAATITAGGGGKSAIVAPWFAKYYGTGDGARTDEPLHTITVKDRMAHMQANIAAPPFGPEHEARAREVAEFLRAHGAWTGGEFVTIQIDGADYVVVDIGMRMLTPRELFNAQGFPADYVIDGVWEGLDTDNPTFRPFPKDVQVSCCGNSVCPPLAKALVQANCGHLAVEQIRRTA